MRKRIAALALTTAAAGLAGPLTAEGGVSAACGCGTGSYVGQTGYGSTNGIATKYRWNGTSWVYQGWANVTGGSSTVAQ